MVVDLTKDDSNSKDNAVELEEVCIVFFFLTMIKELFISTCKLFIFYVPMFYLQANSICGMCLDDDSALELCNDADNNIDNDVLYSYLTKV